MSATAIAGRRRAVLRSRQSTSRILAWVAVALVVIAHLLVLWPSISLHRLWEDEALNLSVPLNLLAGLGYTSDGTLSGSVLSQFDPRISTGPVVLLPIVAALGLTGAVGEGMPGIGGADPVIIARSVIALFYVALLVGLWVLGRRIGGRWAGVIALALPLALNLDQLPSPVQGPADILGEVPTAALLVFAMLAFWRRPWLAGLLIGLAVQSKYIGVLAIPAFALAVWVTVPGASIFARIRRLTPAAVMVAVPTALVELWKLTTLGLGGYIDNTRDLFYFIKSGGQVGYRSPATDKLAALTDSWFVPGPVVVLVLAIVVLVLVAAVVRWRRPGEGRMLERYGRLAAVTDLEPREVVVTFALALVGLVTWVLWWMASGSLPVWIRHPSPGLITFVPVLGAFSVLAVRFLVADGDARADAPAGAGAGAAAGAGARRNVRVAVASVAAVLVVSIGVSDALHVAHARDVHFGETLADQRDAAARVSEELATLDENWVATRWGAGVPLGVLAGAHVGLTDAGAAVEDYARLFSGTPPESCIDVLVSVERYTVCDGH